MVDEEKGLSPSGVQERFLESVRQLAYWTGRLEAIGPFKDENKVHLDVGIRVMAVGQEVDVAKEWQKALEAGYQEGRKIN